MTSLQYYYNLVYTCIIRTILQTEKDLFICFYDRSKSVLLIEFLEFVFIGE